ncbi:leucine-rich repeat-containing protein kinase family protein [uncultured Shewanella sp.]|uniref:leucine-rich repeat-containing protein kinase family protein n=1 Tax=uncultured Shewanella sp. TaxID=173975 RepID=UPI002609D8B9|nr:leucine-rich repeat-containing protein kinase family protein [uncultured Shewanella sp.]
MHTLAQLKSGELNSQKLQRIQIAEQLVEFPHEVLAFADSLEVLDLSNNRLSQLPDEFAQLTELKILFLSFNCFTELPAVIAKCPKLEMIGFKANQITTVAENSLPVDTRWLILTDNQISKLPDSIGDLHRLKKCALAGNKITALPNSMANCTELELLRISANELTQVPDWLLSLPKLAWLAFSGNPVTDNHVSHDSFRQASMADFELGDQLGQGASGVIYQAHRNKAVESQAGISNIVALKMFRGSVTSDGYPKDELHCCLSAGHHPNLIKVLAQISEPDHLGLVMELIPPRFYNLGLPPSLVTCTRDTFADDMDISMAHLVKVMLSMAGALSHLHQHKVSHGDIYAHNTMIDAQANMLFGDFGAATDLSKLSPQQANFMQWIEVRAFGNMLDDLLQQQIALGNKANTTEFTVLSELSQQCLQHQSDLRPSFDEICQQLSKLS